MESNKIRDLIREAQRNKVTTLNLSFTRLTSLPPEILELESLTKLSINWTRLASPPPEISELKNLTELNISRNRLSSLPPEISKLKNLTRLDISRNQLTFLPPEISELRNLTQLNISGNQLSFLPPRISELENLTELDISRNRLSSLPSEISGLKRLTRLDISGNQLTFLPPEISELRNLAWLDIGRNQLTFLPPEVSRLRKLTELYVDDNRLNFLPSGISELKNLTRLDIFGNQLTYLPLEVLSLGLNIQWSLGISIKSKFRLKSNTVLLGKNPFENPPVEIIKQGREAVLNYLKSEGEKKPLNEVRVLLVGDGGAGKTSLVKRLFGEEIDGNEPQTQGINIKKWVVENEEREIKVNFWDFGGQEIMHATHQFFLSKRSLYILVLDGRKDEKPEYWLKLIENFGGESPVLVVINKIDKNPAFELNRKFLREKYPSIKGQGFYRLSCKSNEGIENFSKSLQDELTKIKHLEIKWPKSWFNVKSKLEEICPSCPSIKVNSDREHCNFIQYKEYEAMCAEEGIISESEQNTLVDFLHDLGVILHFRDIPLLNTYVLEPEWVTNAVYKIVNSREIAESRGVLKPDDMLPDILKQSTETDFYYPPYQYDFFVSLMKKFELSYDLDDSTVLLPASLEIQEPNFEFDYEGALRFLIDYDFLPPSVMPRFIVKMHKDIKDNLRWRTGVVLGDENFNSSAVVRADNEAKRINIYANGDQKRDYFAVILQNFREINNSFEKLKATEKIPLPDRPEVTVSYKHLIKLEMRGIEMYMPDGSDDEYSVNDLLGTVINRRSERALLEEILQTTATNTSNEKEILKILRTIQDVDAKSDTDETFLEKVNNIFSVQPTVLGVGVNVNEIVKTYMQWRKRQS